MSILLLNKTDYSSVYKITENSNQYVLKHNYDVKVLLNELSIHEKLKNPYIARFISLKNISNINYIKMPFYDFSLDEIVLTPDLMSKMFIDKNNRNKYFKQMISSINYIHDLNIWHRDIKLSNIMFSEKEDAIKLCDFGISVDFQLWDNKINVNDKLPITGNLSYYTTFRPLECRLEMSEMGLISDIWALGICFFMLSVPMEDYPLYYNFPSGEMAIYFFDFKLSKIDDMPEIMSEYFKHHAKSYGINVINDTVEDPIDENIIDEDETILKNEDSKKRVRNDRLEYTKRIKDHRLKSKEELYDSFDSDLIKILDKMLEVNPLKRITAKELLMII